MARFVQPAIINGSAGLIFASGGKLTRALTIKFVKGKIAEATVIADPASLQQLDLAVLDES